MRWLGVAVLLLVAASAHAQTLRYDGDALRDVIADVERQTDWRFLYSDALVARARVRLSAQPDALPQALARSLAGQGIGVEADRPRRRILLVPARPSAPPTSATLPTAPPRPPEPPTRVVRGRVLDGETGQPLPFATVTWDDGRRGVVTDPAGDFVLTLRDDDVQQRAALTASFVGFGAQTAAPIGSSVVFRLQPQAVPQAAVVVDGIALAALDTAWVARVQPGRYGAIAEGGGLRALEILPSVTPGALFSDGLIVRGSPSDAFEVRLDGVSIYNPRHLFGLVDAFNSDALRAVALHIGVAPADVAQAPGGAVEYVTATGSPRRAQVQLGTSSLASRASVAVPVRPGRTTLLVGGRLSQLGTRLGDGLVEQGLGVVRRTSPLPGGTAEAQSRVVEVDDTAASFWDLHLGLANERPGGGRTVVTAYAGGDNTALNARRFFLRPTPSEPDALARRPVATENRWGSRAASLSDLRLVSPRVSLATTVGGSLYDARFARDDFTFQFLSSAINPLIQRVDTLGYTNELGEGVVSQRLDAVLGDGVASGGYRVHVYRHRYQETASTRAAFVNEQSAARLDLHLAWNGRVRPGLDFDAGVRSHLYSRGRARLSPRVRARLGVAPGVAVTGGLGRSVQFLHRLTLGDVVGAAAWVLSDNAETVTEADLAEASVEIGTSGPTVLLTAYAKRTRGLWLHAEDRAVARATGPIVLARPWLTGVDGSASGIEALARSPLGPWSLGVGAAWTRSDLSHPDLNDGAAFPAAWDRRTRVTLLADGPVVPGVRLALAWTGASGAPNPLADELGEADRLQPLSRLDLRLSARRSLGSATVSLAVAVRNVFDRDNVVTREPTTLVGRERDGTLRLGVVPLDVYDAGVLPTVDLAVRW